MITIGTNDKGLQERMLREPDINLDKCIKLGQAAEITRKHAKINQAQSEEKSTAAFTKTVQAKKPPFPDKGQGATKIQQCKFCSYSHNRGNCPAFNKFCNTCGKRGHFSTCCCQKRVRAVSKNVASDPSSDQDSFPDTDENKDYFVGAVHHDEKAPPEPS